MTEVPCNVPNCARCRERYGGYNFSWVSPLWTEQWFIFGFFPSPEPGRDISGREWRSLIANADDATISIGTTLVKGHAGDKP